VHIESLGTAREAVAAGADGLAHVMGDQAPDEAFLQLARTRGVFVVPTLAMTHNLAGNSESPATLADRRLAVLLGPEARAALARTAPKPLVRQFRAADAATRALADGGIPLLVGSDAPNPGTAHGATVHIELALLVRIGLTPVAALAAATAET